MKLKIELTLDESYIQSRIDYFKRLGLAMVIIDPFGSEQHTE